MAVFNPSGYVAVYKRIVTHLRSALSQLRAAYRADRMARVIIHLLIAIASIFVFLHALKYGLLSFGLEPGLLWPRSFDLDRERGYAEFFNYFQAGLCTALLIGIFLRTGARVYATWALAYAFVMADDALSVHERIGRHLRIALDLPALPGLRAQDSGELAAWAAAGALILAVLGWGFRTSSAAANGFGSVFAIAFAALVFFGGAMDMLHSALRNSPVVSDLFTVIEDGGEMLTLAVTSSCALLLYRQSTAHAGAKRRRSGEAP